MPAYSFTLVRVMSNTIEIRAFCPGEEAALFKVHYSAIHRIASRDYSAEQIQAWAPEDQDADLWAQRMRDINPFVAEYRGKIVGYADLQSNGYIDHFFVSGEYPRLGIGSTLMRHILASALQRRLPLLSPDVSRTAQPFFEHFGFVVVEQRLPQRRGVTLPNALMHRRL